jgi:hypothetical protein
MKLQFALIPYNEVLKDIKTKRPLKNFKMFFVLHHVKIEKKTRYWSTHFTSVT